MAVHAGSRKTEGRPGNKAPPSRRHAENVIDRNDTNLQTTRALHALALTLTHSRARELAGRFSPEAPPPRRHTENVIDRNDTHHKRKERYTHSHSHSRARLCSGRRSSPPFFIKTPSSLGEPADPCVYAPSGSALTRARRVCAGGQVCTIFRPPSSLASREILLNRKNPPPVRPGCTQHNIKYLHASPTKAPLVLTYIRSTCKRASYPVGKITQTLPLYLSIKELDPRRTRRPEHTPVLASLSRLQQTNESDKLPASSS